MNLLSIMSWVEIPSCSKTCKNDRDLYILSHAVMVLSNTSCIAVVLET